MGLRLKWKKPMGDQLRSFCDKLAHFGVELSCVGAMGLAGGRSCMVDVVVRRFWVCAQEQNLVNIQIRRKTWLRLESRSVNTTISV